MVTLTYADQCLPPGGKLQLEHMQKFFRAIRKRGHYVRYFWAGEYGPKTHRPHYHALMFGMDFLEQSEKLPTGDYVSPLLADFWQHGTHQVTPFSMATACYVAGYVDKKNNDLDTLSRMSRKPGLGYQYLALHADTLLRLGHVVVEGRSFPLPHRYLDWMEEALPDSTAEIRAARRRIAKQNLPLPYEPSKWEGRYQNAQARLRSKGESL